ncbi:hypothetical protein FKP32DRAFT_1560770 [Trametes sanguinea]|nr:hypothetical protein FKP32DRAFT_1560770 [Trametes sanguinea]
MATPSTDEYLRILSIAIFASLTPGTSTLSLYDPNTGELCEYRVQKVSRPLDTPSLDTSSDSIGISGSSTQGTSYSPLAGASQRKPRSLSLDAKLRSDLLNKLLLTGSSVHRASYLEKGSIYPASRLSSLSVRVRGDGTPPSLWNDSQSSDATALSLAPTPVRKLFHGAATRNAHTPASSSAGSSSSGSTRVVGLGFSDLFQEDGTLFDGLGSLPRQTSTPHRSYISPGAPRLMWTAERDQDSDGSRGSVSSSTSAGDFFREAAQGMRSPPGAPAHRGTAWRPQSVTLPARPEEDDVFFSQPVRVPGSLTQGIVRRASSKGRGSRVNDRKWRGEEEATRPSSAAGSTRGSLQMTAEWVALEKERCAGERRPAWKP